MNDELSLQIWNEVPRVFFDASVDSKGRLKLPVKFQDGFTKLGNQIFYTSLDGLEIRLYPSSHWTRQSAKLEDLISSPDPKVAAAADSSLFRAAKYGDEGGMDSEGRIHLPPVLRQKVGLTTLPAAVHLRKQQDHIQVLTGARFNELDAMHDAKGVDDVSLLRAHGLR